MASCRITGDPQTPEATRSPHRACYNTNCRRIAGGLMGFLSALKRTVIGRPIASKHAHLERLAIPVGLAVFASDALSSVAYATEEVMHVLVRGGTMAAYYKTLPISLVLILLMVTVAISYSQTIYAYPNGGGTYSVSSDNLGRNWGKVAGASLLLDYTLTVSVSVSSGTAAIVSMFPQTQPFMVPIALGAIALICLGNLRGVKESGILFSLPTYGFVVTMIVLIIFALTKAVTTPATPPNLPDDHLLQIPAWLLILKGFAASCTALTGIEAVSNGVPAFKAPSPRNAVRTLWLMIVLLGVMFLGVSFAAVQFGITPMDSSQEGYRTVLAQIAAKSFGDGSVMYYAILIATAAILFLAANTAFADFPRLASLMARDGFLPRQLMSQGDRLVFQNGIIILAVVAGGLVVAYNADTHSLVPLYAVGVFIGFTLSQAGMFIRFRRQKALLAHRLHVEDARGMSPDYPAAKAERGRLNRKMAINLFGGVVTFIVCWILLITKWEQGSWLVVIVVLGLMMLFYGIRRHYDYLAQSLSVGNQASDLKAIKSLTLLLVPRVHKGILHAIQYAQSSAPDCRALHVTLDAEKAKSVRNDWITFGADMPLVILESPYRSLIEPVIEYIDELRAKEPDMFITVIVPQAVPKHWWQGLLHGNAATAMKWALGSRKNVVITSIRYFLP